MRIGLALRAMALSLAPVAQFFYLCGAEVPRAILLIDGARGDQGRLDASGRSPIQATARSH
jgi:hypothetical protein